jgi:hypothetical protein
MSQLVSEVVRFFRLLDLRVNRIVIALLYENDYATDVRTPIGQPGTNDGQDR